MHGIIIGLNNPNLFFHLTNRTGSHEDTEMPTAESKGYPFLSEFQLIILFTLNVYVYRKKKQPKVSPGGFTRFG